MHHRDLYSEPPETRGAYLDSPAFAQAIGPLTFLPWSVFYALWRTAIFTAYVWLLGPLPLCWRLPLLVISLSFDSAGNVWALFALAVGFGFPPPVLCAFPALTKVTPFPGPVWFGARTGWRNVAIAVGTTLGTSP